MTESTWWLDLLKVLAVILLILVNAFFVAAEFALVSVRRTRVRELVEKGNRAARWVERTIADMNTTIAATQLGITICGLALGWIAEPALAHLLEPIVRLFPPASQSTVSRSLSAGLAFALVTFMVVVVGELAPKSIALQNPERTALIVAPPTLWMKWLLRPAVLLLNGTGNAVLRLIGVEPAAGHQLVHSVEELKMLVSVSAESGLVESQEEEMVHAVFELGELLVRQVMVPRTEMVAVPADSTLDQVLQTAAESRYTKLPVYEDSLDHVIGIVHLKDLLPHLSQDAANSKNLTARDLMREAIFVPETLRVVNLLERFRARRQHIAIVLDEYGGTAGLVTLEDLLEEIVGEVSDPFDTEPDIQPLPDGSHLIDGLTLIEEVNEHFGLNLSDPHYDTIAGFILGRLGRVAKVGDTVVVDGVRLRVEAMDGLRIARVSLTPLKPAEQPQTAGGD